MAVRIGVIGLGDIACKAYLPVLTSQPGVEPRLLTRNEATLYKVGDRYRVPARDRHRDLGDLIDSGLDAAFVHAATEAHPALVTALLEAGVPTYVDKPLAYSLTESETLVRLAENRSVPLMVGFNRRFAPGYAQCQELPRELIVLQKHRVGLPRDAREVIFDDFIHVVDTLLYLAPEPYDQVDVRARQVDGQLHHVVLQLSNGSFTALGIMNRLSGSSEEVLEVSGQDSKREVRNLAEIIDHKGQPSVRRRGDWVPVARQRGIEQAVLAFLHRVRTGGPGTEQQDLDTHRLCEQILTHVVLDAA